ncbi:kinase-like protein [Trematosphaeria pertusa]|uniref:non-specific serine/threonine protein kinase n=1 Tax=Trematosphaeria pertusa TaxID=390896 RepID=A0A6A6I6L1_9PLEO|nr:kinase-like protein [Trematosphaeria pertusa]KAF2245170.1 kinase-like protein [Trematosphaeria pertusa]
MLKREVETFARMSHPNIVEFKAVQGFGGTHLEIFAALREGNINDLIEKELFLREPKWAEALLRQMLQALDYLAFKGIVHRDVKPANILYQSLSGGSYTFQLTDFGLCNFIVAAQTFAGSPMFMAPEFHLGIQQTSKVDVWSLFVTLAYALNVSEFRKKRFDTHTLRVRAAQEAANEAGFHPIRAMVIVDPKARASAADMLDALFHGEGRSTPRDQMQSAPKVDRNASTPRKEQTHRIKKTVAQRRHGQEFEGFVTTARRKMPGAFQDDVVEALGGVQDRPHFT